MRSTAAKVALGTVAATQAVAAAAVAGVLVAMPVGVEGAGAVLAELQGHTRTTSRAEAAEAPRGTVPYWTRAVGSAVTVVRPGVASGADDRSVRVDMDLAPGAAPPAECRPVAQPGPPWDGGGSWPDLSGERVLLCEGWATAVVDGRLYAWTVGHPQG
ncbi:hypothetical protein [Geodermatophilus sp. SYSU D00696]